jgi:hypothetical protein
MIDGADDDRLEDLISAAQQREADRQAALRLPLMNVFRGDLEAELAEPVREALLLTYHWDADWGPTAVFYVEDKQWTIHRTRTASSATTYNLPGLYSWVVQLQGVEVLECPRSELQNKLLLAIGKARTT